MKNDINTGWDYSDLVKMAKLNNGPEELLNNVKMEGYRQGAVTATLVGISIVGVATLVWIEAPKVVAFFKERKAKKEKETFDMKYPEEYTINLIKVINDEDESDFVDDCLE